jgi:tRNA threonylcarbamoyladenosine biosynthesis protein TsaE
MRDLLLSIQTREDTDRLGKLIGAIASPGDVIGLTGDLGAGKTFLAGAIAHAVGVSEAVPIASPTFNLIREYHQGRLPVYHMDLYRLGDPSELYELGLWEYYDGDGICLVEWSNLFDDLWPKRALVVEISLGVEECRTISLRGERRGRDMAEMLHRRWVVR